MKLFKKEIILAIKLYIKNLEEQNISEFDKDEFFNLYLSKYSVFKQLYNKFLSSNNDWLSIIIFPLLGLYSPAIILRNVDFPEPFTPLIPIKDGKKNLAFMLSKTYLSLSWYLKYKDFNSIFLK